MIIMMTLTIKMLLLMIPMLCLSIPDKRGII